MSRGGAIVYPAKLSEIDELTRREHSYLSESDACYFIGEYTARGGHGASDTNNLILNFKKGMDRHGLPEWVYKGRAIQQVATLLDHALGESMRDDLTIVPVPPSRCKSDPLHDDRLVRALNALPGRDRLDVRELIIQDTSMVAATHVSATRPKPRDLCALWRVDEQLAEPEPVSIMVFDDVLTTGSHFVAAKKLLGERFPNSFIFGVFVARRAIQSEDPPEDW